MTSIKKKSILSLLTSVHGVNHLDWTNGLKSWFWTLVIAGNFIFSIVILVVIKQRYDKNLLYIKVDGTCRVNQVPFPAVSICNSNVISKRETGVIYNILKNNNRPEEEITDFFNSIQDMPYIGYGARYMKNFTQIMNILKHHHFTMDIIMEELHQKCENLLVHCEFNKRVKKCTDIFKLIKTLEGHCCAFNYAALSDISEDSILEEDTELEYYDDRKVGSIITTSKSGRTSGLTVILNTEPDDYPSWSKALYYGAKVIISDPNDFPETTVVFKYISIGESVDLKIEPLVFLSDESLRRLSAIDRSCWFHDEVLLQHTDRYSFETCNTECAMKSYFDRCGCVPYRYPRGKDTKICEPVDMPCLLNMTIFYTDTNCTCYLECSDKKYKVKTNRLPLSSKETPSYISNKYNISDLALLKVYFGEPTCNCYTKKIMMDYDKVIGMYGGVISLNLGGSVMTVVEILYLILSYLVAILWRKVCQWRNR